MENVSFYSFDTGIALRLFIGGKPWDMKFVIPGKFPKVFDSASVVCHCLDIKGVRQRAISKPVLPASTRIVVVRWRRRAAPADSTAGLEACAVSRIARRRMLNAPTAIATNAMAITGH